MENHEKEAGFKETNISLVLSSYDGIFSDFDPRSYSERALSVDFLDEAKRASRDKVTGEIELNLLIQRQKRSLKEESMIKKRIKEHFKKHFHELKNEKTKVIKNGLIFSFCGIMLMIIATILIFEGYEKTLLITFLIVIMEPGGWFLFWEGLNLVIFESKTREPDLSFYKKMSQAVIRFTSYR